MVSENLQCPACGVMNTVDIDESTFICPGCGKEAITQAAAAFTSAQEELIKNAPLARTITTDDEESRMLKRAAIFLEDEDWPRAWAYYESVLDYNPENAQAYIGELLVKLRLKNAGCLSQSYADFSELSEFKRAVRYSDEPHRTKLQELSTECKKRVSQSFHKLTEERNAQRERNEEIYKRANRMRLGIEAGGNLEDAVRLLEYLGDWKDSREMALEIRQKLKSSPESKLFDSHEAIVCWKAFHPSALDYCTVREPSSKKRVVSFAEAAERYEQASRMRLGIEPGGSLAEAAKLYGSLGYWMDSQDMAQKCRKMME